MKSDMTVSMCSFFPAVMINCIDSSLAFMMLCYNVLWPSVEFFFLNWPVGMNTMLVSQPLSEFEYFISRLFVTKTRGDELGLTDTQSPDGSYCLRCV